MRCVQLPAVAACRRDSRRSRSRYFYDAFGRRIVKHERRAHDIRTGWRYARVGKRWRAARPISTGEDALRVPSRNTSQHRAGRSTVLQRSISIRQQMKVQSADSVFREIRKILGVQASAVTQATAAVASISTPYKEIATWTSTLQGTNLRIPWSAEELHLYGGQATLESGQIGYRVDASGGRSSDWKEEWLVLGQISGDPIIGEFDKNACPILFARHGSGSWRANRVSDDITSAGEHIDCRGRCRRRSATCRRRLKAK